MRNWILIFCSVAALSLQASATEIPSLNTRLADIEKSCFERDWAAVQCEFEKGENYSSAQGIYARTPIIDDLVTFATSLVKRYGIDSTIYYIRRFSAESGMIPDIEPIIRRVHFVKLQMRAAQIADAKKLSACKRACLANCIAAHSMEYVAESNIRSLVPADSLARGFGNCQHFSTMSSYLSHYLGNQYTLAVGSLSMGHQFVATRLNGRWWYSEPQNDQCRFFPAKYRGFSVD